MNTASSELAAELAMDERALRPLTKREIFGYSVGDLGLNLNFQMMGFYLAFFYTDVFGIPAGHVAGLFLAARVWDAINDPLMGVIADRTQTKRGKFRPYLLFGALPLNLVLVACFFTPDLPMTGKIVYAYVTYILHGMVYTAVGLPYSAISAVMTQDQQERAVISSYRMFFAVVVALSAIILVRPLAEGYFSSPREGYTAAMLTVAAISTGLLWLSYAKSKERLVLERKKYSLRQLLPLLSKNDALGVLALAIFLSTCVWVMINAVSLYYFRYVYQDPKVFERFYFLTLPANVAGVVAAPWLTKRVGKTRTFMIGSALAAAFYALRYFVPQGNLVLFLGVSCIAGFGMMLGSITQWAMLPDTVEYGHWKTGVRSEGLPFAFCSFMQKLGLAVAGSLASYVLSASGYHANQQQPQSVITAIEWLFNLLPAALAALCALTLLFYRIDGSLFARVQSELSARSGR